MNKTFLIALIFGYGILQHASSHAQTHEFGVSGGMMNYKGELAVLGNLAYPKSGFGAFYRYNVTRASSWTLQGIYGQIAQDDANSGDLFAKMRGHKFETDIIEFSGQWEYNFLNFRRETKRMNESRQNLTPYFFCGLGYMLFSPKYNKQVNYATNSVVIPVGVGIKYALNRALNLGLVIGARATFTDQLDDMGVEVTSSSNTPRNPKYYTNNGGNDQYYFTSITLSYILQDKGKECPKGAL